MVRAAFAQGQEALAVMRRAEADNDSAAYRSSVQRGAAVLKKLHADVLASFNAEQREVIEKFLASAHVHDYKHHAGSHH